jgi:regulatory protein
MKKQKTKKEAISALEFICSKQEKSPSEILEKLNDWGLETEDRTEIYEHLIKNKFIDETRYSTAFFHDKIRFNKWGLRKIKYMLHQKGISSSTIEDVLFNIDEQEYYNIIKEEISKKINQIKISDKWQVRNKIFRFSESRGYEPDITNKVLQELIK